MNKTAKNWSSSVLLLYKLAILLRGGVVRKSEKAFSSKMPLKKSKILLTDSKRKRLKTFIIDEKRKVAEKPQTLFTDNKSIAAEKSLASFTYP
jgi:hypothetical protein